LACRVASAALLLMVLLLLHHLLLLLYHLHAVYCPLAEPSLACWQ
jgi:hypothetical protein